MTGLFGETCERVDFPKFSLAVYGCSYYSREVTDNLYGEVRPSGAMQHHVLLAHGGDDRHSPWKKRNWLRQVLTILPVAISINRRS